MDMCVGEMRELKIPHNLAFHDVGSKRMKIPRKYKI